MRLRTPSGPTCSNSVPNSSVIVTPMVDFWLYLSNGQDAPINVRFRGVNLNGCRESSENSNYSIFVQTPPDNTGVSSLVSSPLM